MASEKEDWSDWSHDVASDEAVERVTLAINEDLAEYWRKFWLEEEKVATRRLMQYRKRDLFAVSWSEAPTRSFHRSAHGKRIQFLVVAVEDVERLNRVSIGAHFIGTEEELWADIAQTIDRAARDAKAGEPLGKWLHRLALSDFFGFVAYHARDSVITVVAIVGLERARVKRDDDPPPPRAEAAALDRRVASAYLSAVAKVMAGDKSTEPDEPTFTLSRTRCESIAKHCRRRRTAHLIREILSFDKS